MVKPSARAQYALRTMIDLAVSEGLGPVPLRDLAKDEPVSRKYLEQLAGALHRSGLVRVARGPNGGYELARPAYRITAKEIIEAVDGPTTLLDCLTSPASCRRTGICAARRMWARVSGVIAAVLDETTLADLREKQRAAEGDYSPCYQI